MTARKSTKKRPTPAAPFTVTHKEPVNFRINTDEGRAMILRAAGTKSYETAGATLVTGLVNAVALNPDRSIDERTLFGSIATMAAMKPRNELEALLIMQMLATNAAAIEHLRRLKGSTTIEAIELNGLIASKMLRTFTMQTEALNRSRGKGKSSQRVTVRHVYVGAGGQAIVGNVTRGRPGGQRKIEVQAHAKAIAHAPKPALRGSFQANGKAMSGARDD